MGGEFGNLTASMEGVMSDCPQCIQEMYYLFLDKLNPSKTATCSIKTVIASKATGRL